MDTGGPLLDPSLSASSGTMGSFPWGDRWTVKHPSFSVFLVRGSFKMADLEAHTASSPVCLAFPRTAFKYARNETCKAWFMPKQIS